MKELNDYPCTAQEERRPDLQANARQYQRSLSAAREHNEPAGQSAFRELEIVRIKGALQRAEEVGDDVAAAIEGLL